MKQPEGGDRAASLKEKVLEVLRHEIRSGALGQGVRLVERELTRRFGVSRTPFPWGGLGTGDPARRALGPESEASPLARSNSCEPIGCFWQVAWCMLAYHLWRTEACLTLLGPGP